MLMGATTRTRLPGLDVLRGFAIALVLLRHAVPDLAGNAGIVGVVVFFTLSGYLITGVLVGEFERTGSVLFSEFFRRRAIRLFPPLLLLLAVFSVVELLTDRLESRWYLGKTLLTALTYTSDLPLLPISPGLGHLWTLAIEEQFYLVWPFLLVFALRRRWLRPTMLLTATLFLLATLVTVVAFHDNIGYLYKLPTSWSMTLLIGAAARIFRDQLEGALGRPALLGVLGAATCLLVAAGPDSKNSALMYLVGGPLVAISTALLIRAAVRWKALPAILVPLQSLGVISYSVYLWNYLIVCWVRGDGSSPVTLTAGLVGAAGAILAATLSWFALERPIKNRWGTRRCSRHREAPLFAEPPGRTAKMD